MNKFHFVNLNFPIFDKTTCLGFCWAALLYCNRNSSSLSPSSSPSISLLSLSLDLLKKFENLSKILALGLLLLLFEIRLEVLEGMTEDDIIPETVAVVVDVLGVDALYPGRENEAL